MKVEIKYSSQANKYINRNDLTNVIHSVIKEYLNLLRGKVYK